MPCLAARGLLLPYVAPVATLCAQLMKGAQSQHANAAGRCHASRVLLHPQGQLESGLVMPQDMEAVAAAVSGVLRDADLQVSKLSSMDHAVGRSSRLQ